MIAQTSTHKPYPLYDASKTDPAYELRYAWTGWPSQQRFHETPTALLDELESLWETDGLRLLEHNWTGPQIQLLFSARPHVRPEFLASRAKGRLDHAIRSAGLQMPLSRKLGVRSVGDNVTQEVESYILGHAGPPPRGSPR